MEITEKQFARLCYLVLMQNIGTKAPHYVEEKSGVMDSGYDAFGYLDPINQGIVIDYLRTWHYLIPEPINNYLNDL